MAAGVQLSSSWEARPATKQVTPHASVPPPYASYVYVLACWLCGWHREAPPIEPLHRWAGVYGSQSRDDYTADDVEQYFNYMGMLATEVPRAALPAADTMISQWLCPTGWWCWQPAT